MRLFYYVLSVHRSMQGTNGDGCSNRTITRRIIKEVVIEHEAKKVGPKSCGEIRVGYRGGHGLPSQTWHYPS